ncbi:hypothetical protein QYE76_017099 [Lolium multiflorum]|uniref:Reverse transcriptase Ty1/copia-type domain-containing protein n=1 Tax=Lolium multiflorum TaxID=4521 RepID=A0AAD8PYL8_LOLMU|nr:hypothetical protein QYE76_017099 [Lolium multiflorum]
MRGLRLWGMLFGEVSCSPRPVAPTVPVAPPPVALAPDATQADKDAAKSADDTALADYDRKIQDHSTTVATYRLDLTEYTQWIDKDARVAAVLTSSVLPQYAAEFMGLPTAAAQWAFLRQRYQPSGDALYLSVVRQEHALQQGDCTIDETLSVVFVVCSLVQALPRRVLLVLCLALLAPRDHHLPHSQYVIPVVSGFWSFFSYDLLKMNLFSASQLTDSGCRVILDADSCAVQDRRTQVLVGAGPRSLESPGLWELDWLRMSFPSRPVRQRRAPVRYSPSQYGLSVVSEPTSYRDAERHPEWQLAMAEEIAALERTGTWDLVSPPSGVRPITCKWFYKIKTRSDGSLERYKARLVARGFQQEHGRDYDETFAPVTHMTTVRTLLDVASVRRWSVSQLDVQNAFLNGELSEEVYMQPPPGYSVPDGMVCRLRRSLYGLKQAPRAWFERFASVVTAAGFSPSLHDPALFVHTSPRGRTLLLLYVDDMIITGDDPEYIAFVKARLRDQFLMTDLGPLHYFLGIEVSSTSGGFSIPQQKYIQDLLARAALRDERTVDTPMELNVKLHPTDGDPLPDPTH